MKKDPGMALVNTAQKTSMEQEAELLAFAAESKVAVESCEAQLRGLLEKYGATRFVVAVSNVMSKAVGR